MLAATALVVVFCGSAMAKVTGVCANCHTMHNSEDGSALAGGPRATLLTNSCVGCHTGDNIGGSTPYVMGANPPVYGTNTLAGGNFWWCENVSDAMGHNVFTANPDDELGEVGDSGAPGGEFNGCGDDSCHNNLHAPYTGGTDGYTGKYGCEGCHLKPRHHADDSASVVGETGGWYRFLSGHAFLGPGKGVEGVEAPDWELNANAGSHNEYLGVDMAKTGTGHMSGSTHTTTAYCTGCHGNFHIQDTTATGESPWIRHPSDAVLPSDADKEYKDYTIYNPQAPVARPSLPVADPAVVEPGADMVMCLSCHRPHGSPYDDLLRWDYDQMVAGDNTKSGGCFVCHTTKNGT